jgi:DNA-binding transcriptional ArsR family regulator
VSVNPTAAVASLLADPSRLAMIELLLDGGEHRLADLALAAEVGSPTASGHVRRLEAGGLVASRRSGRERLVRLAGPAVAAAHEALSALAVPDRPRSLRGWTRHEQLRAARTCYDHLAGRLGVAIADAARAQGALDATFALTPGAGAWFDCLGVDLDALRALRRPLLRVCTDWTERREHLAGALGAAVCTGAFASGWVVGRPGTRAVRLTSRGEAALRRLAIVAG